MLRSKRYRARIKHHVIFLIGSLTLSLSSYLIYTPLQSISGEPPVTDAAKRDVWALELSRWARYCFKRIEREGDMLGGCRTRLDALTAAWAIYRSHRLTGYIQPVDEALSSAQFEKKLSTEILAQFTPNERGTLINLSLEALRATGDTRWLAVTSRALKHSAWLNSDRKCTLGEDCVEELIALISAAQFLTQAESQLARETQPAWRSSELTSLLSQLPRLQEAAVQLARTHPTGHLAADRGRGGHRSWWAKRAELAARSLPAEQLSIWWQTEALTEVDLHPIKELTSRQWGVNFDRAKGLAALIAAWPHSDQALQADLSIINTAFQYHALTGMQIYLKHRRNQRGYGRHVPARGVISLTTDRPLNQLSIDFPPRRWRDHTLPPTIQSSLPAGGIQAQGMFSKLMVRDESSKRGLYFIRPNGTQLLETEVDLTRPEVLQVRYTQDMLGVYPLLNTPPKRALLIGLGGGAMVHALHAYDPKLQLDVVEIDPVVVRFARDYFGIKELEEDKTDQTWLHLYTADGFAFLKAEQEVRYDVIWMDAFLQPSAETDSTGSPLNLKTRDFLKDVATRKLTPQGIIVININHHEGLRRDIQTIRATFPASSIWRVPQTGNYVAVGFNESPASVDQWQQRAEQISDQQATPFRHSSQIKRMVDGLEISVPASPKATVQPQGTQPSPATSPQPTAPLPTPTPAVTSPSTPTH